jgi:tRNA threonylcarbamoyladenosine biosynthesis protein TsaB
VIVLAVHSSTPRLGLAIVRDGEVAAEEILPSGREHLENIAPVVQRVMARLGTGLESLAGFGVAVGPGSFSGIRVGMSFVKGLALALKKPVVGISSLEILARQTLDDREYGAAIIDARRGEVYASVYRRVDGRLMRLDQPRLIPAAEFHLYARRFSQQLVLCGDPVIEILRESMTESVRAVIAPPSPGVCAQIAWELLKEGKGCTVHSLSPLYIRRSDAEEKRRALLSALPVTHDNTHS